MAERLGVIYAELVRVIDLHHPDEFCIETAFYGKNVQATLKLGQVRGIALLAAVHRSLAIAEYAPREVKRSVTGSGAASKQQVQYMVKTLLNHPGDFSRSDESDGLALAITHALKSSLPRAQHKDWASFIADNPGRIRS
jgi:crossover junction endodeoxyribonuclease RuvC